MQTLENFQGQVQEAERKRNEDMQEMRRQMTQLKTAQDQQIQGLTKEMQEVLSRKEEQRHQAPPQQQQQPLKNPYAITQPARIVASVLDVESLFVVTTSITWRWINTVER